LELDASDFLLSLLDRLAGDLSFFFDDFSSDSRRLLLLEFLLDFFFLSLSLPLPEPLLAESIDALLSYSISSSDSEPAYKNYFNKVLRVNFNFIKLLESLHHLHHRLSRHCLFHVLQLSFFQHKHHDLNLHHHPIFVLFVAFF